ncbi:MurR/RpiR family transcriptional regulator [Bacillus timonensis]|nr:MurR/RpiR family transcriptional regulator [Bacillus timonensis]
MQELLQKLKDSYGQLSAGQKKVAKVFFENPNKIAFSPAFEIGKHVDVSESTVIRLTQKIGYKGYAEVQEIIQKDLSKQRVLNQYIEMANLCDQSFMQQLLDSDVENIANLKRMLDEERLQRVVSQISQARNIYITGNLLSYGLAHFFSSWLNMILGNTELVLNGADQYYQQLSKMNEEDVLIALILPRYMKSTVETVTYAKKLGAKVISITDSELSPVCASSDIVLTVPITSSINIDSYTAVISLLTMIMRSVSIQDSERVEKNLHNMENVYRDNHIFYT